MNEEAGKTMDTLLQEQRVLQFEIQRRADRFVEMLAGNLRHVSGYRLKKLKRELGDFNMHTGRWKTP